MRVKIKNIKSGELREIKVGFSWTLLVFSGFLGLPLFLRGLHALGAIFLVLWVLALVAGGELLLLLAMTQLGLILWLGFKGNEMTAKKYLSDNWIFSDPDSDEATYARQKWGLAKV